ncbi:hypothetical protein GCM10010232_33710 [Streptomyces amakusaensis]
MYATGAAARAGAAVAAGTAAATNPEQSSAPVASNAVGRRRDPARGTGRKAEREDMMTVFPFPVRAATGGDRPAPRKTVAGRPTATDPTAGAEDQDAGHPAAI